MISLCFVCLIFILILDTKANNNDRQIKNVTHIEVEKVQLSDMRKFSRLFWGVAISTALGYGCLCYNMNIQLMLILNYHVSNVQAGFYIALQYII